MDRLGVFIHLIYECKKGVRDMALCSLPYECRHMAVRKLEVNGMSWFISPINDTRFNIFFGDEECIKVVKSFCDKPLNMLSPEEDFILGALLGYSLSEQCRRYCSRSKLTVAL